MPNNPRVIFEIRFFDYGSAKYALVRCNPNDPNDETLLAWFRVKSQAVAHARLLAGRRHEIKDRTHSARLA